MEFLLASSVDVCFTQYATTAGDAPIQWTAWVSSVLGHLHRVYDKGFGDDEDFPLLKSAVDVFHRVDVEDMCDDGYFPVSSSRAGSTYMYTVFQQKMEGRGRSGQTHTHTL